MKIIKTTEQIKFQTFDTNFPISSAPNIHIIKAIEEKSSKI